MYLCSPSSICSFDLFNLYFCPCRATIHNVKVKPKAAVLNMLKRLDKIRFRGPKRDDVLDLPESPTGSDTECSDDMLVRARPSIRDNDDQRDPVSHCLFNSLCFSHSVLLIHHANSSKLKMCVCLSVICYLIKWCGNNLFIPDTVVLASLILLIEEWLLLSCWWGFLDPWEVCLPLCSLFILSLFPQWRKH